MNKNKTLSLLLPLAALFVIAACHDDDNHPSMKEHTRYTISTEPSSLRTFATKGEKQTIKVTAKKIVETFLGDTHQEDKDVISNAEFTVKTEGEGFSQEIKDSTITVTANENTENTVRKGTLTITIKEDNSKFIKLELTQEAGSSESKAEYTLSVSPENFPEFDAKGGNGKVTVNAIKTVKKYINGVYQEGKDVVSDAEFTTKIEGAGFSQKTDNKTVTVTASENTTSSARSGKLTITVKEDDTKFAKLELKQKVGNVYQPFPAGHIFSHLSKFNVGKTPKSFTDSQDNDKSGYYSWSSAQTACPDGYHLPSKKEFNVFVPDMFTKDYITFDETSSTAYAIIGEGSDRAAYRYQKVGNFEPGNIKSHWEITGRYLGNSHNEVTKETISDENWWKANNINDIVHLFPAAGHYDDTGSFVYLGVSGSFWSSDVDGTVTAFDLVFGRGMIFVGGGRSKEHKIQVRCIKN